MKTNKAFIIGRLSADAEIGKTKKGVPVAKFTVLWDKPNAKEDDRPNAFRVERYGAIPTDSSEIKSEDLKKGTLVEIEGKIQTGSYERDGERKYTRVLIANSVKKQNCASPGVSLVVFKGTLQSDCSQRYINNADNTCITELFVKVPSCNKEGVIKGNDFLPATLIGRLGEKIGRYLVKDKDVFISGPLQTDSWKKDDGSYGDSWKVVVDNILLLGETKEEGTHAASPDEPIPETEESKDESFEETAFAELPPEFDEEYFDDEV